MDNLKHSKSIAAWTIVIACIVGVLFSFKLTSILDAIILFSYPYMGSMLVPLLAGVLYKRATIRGCFAAMVVGGVIGTACFFAGIPGPLNNWVNPDMGLFIAYAASLVVIVAVSETDPKNVAVRSSASPA